MNSKGEIILYQTKDKKVQLEVKLKQETIWLTQAQIAKLFQTDRSVITRHINNIFKSKELEEISNVQKMHIALSDKPIKLYGLDVVISVGYRVNSSRATQFRIWATSILKKYLIDGYALNERRLQEQKRKLEALQKAIRLIHNVKGRKELEYKEAMGLLEVISDYSYALELLDDYDARRLKISGTSKEEKFKLTYEKALKAVRQLKKKFGNSGLFAQEKDKSFKSSISSIYQTFDRKELYPSIEEKAANLLYFIVKNHSFVDGNKRIAASIFLWFLENNRILYKEDGAKRIPDNALVALTLMIAESNPVERDVIVTLVINLINKNN
ncbi:MAG: RhuM family protein [Candidatus Omnitrophota bacterium]|nr:RhuM family protein [Candidatus Omnitrophota bacterium]